jgi:two-component system OmpR family sensor kinase
MMRGVRRLSIRLRVTLVFAAVMALVLGATGVFVYLRFEAELDHTVDAGLRSRADELAATVQAAGPGHLGDGQHLVGRSESFAEVLGPGGTVVDSSPALGARSLLGGAELRRAQRGPLILDRGPLPGLDGSSRLLAAPVSGGSPSRVVVVGTSTASRDESLTDLAQLLLLGLPVALLLASLAGYGVATAALRPVEAMRLRAEEISIAAPDERLPVPPTRDELGRLGETLNEMLARLGEALEHERAFVADASHELRTPLAILRTELELALAEGRSPAELRAALVSAAEESDRLSQLADDLLTIAQTDRGELPLRLERVELGEVLEGVRRRFESRAAAEGRELTVSSPPLEPAVDRLRLDQAVGSVVDNALRYGEGAVEIRAEASTAADPDRGAEGFAIVVADRGPGFPPEFVPRAFDRFSRAAARGDGGSGLGLAIVRTVVRAHGGEAEVTNREGGGAEVRLSFPLDPGRRR